MKSTAGVLPSVFLLTQNALGAAISTSITSTAISSPTNAVVNTGKRGLAYNNATLSQYYSLSGQKSHVSWAYNWDQSDSSGDLNTALTYIPMLWSDEDTLTSTWSSAAQRAIDNGASALFSFNEPDLCVSGSSCISVDDAVAAYQTHIQPFAGSAKLGAPAITNGVGTAEDPMGVEYLSAFLDACTDCTIDFVAMHWYSTISSGAAGLQAQVEAVRAVANGKPIWVTEFGINADSGATDEELEEFLEEAMKYLDSQTDVHKYAYFYNAPEYLIDETGTGMSALGEVYNSYGNATKAATTTTTIAATLAAATATTLITETTVTVTELPSSFPTVL